MAGPDNDTSEPTDRNNLGNGDDAGKDGGDKNESIFGLGKIALRGIEKITKLVLGTDSKPGERLLVYICFGIIVLSVLTVLIPPYESTKQLIAGILGVLALLALLILVTFRGGRRHAIPPTDHQDGE